VLASSEGDESKSPWHWKRSYDIILALALFGLSRMSIPEPAEIALWSGSWLAITHLILSVHDCLRPWKAPRIIAMVVLLCVGTGVIWYSATTPQLNAAPESRRDLAESALGWASRMHDFEMYYEQRRNDSDATFQIKEIAAFKAMTQDPASTIKQLRAEQLASESASADERIEIEEDNEFQKQILPRAVELRDQMLPLIKDPPTPDPMAAAVFKGRFAGPYPISDAANYLARLARSVEP
jgi:hypothetical protein